MSTRQELKKRAEYLETLTDGRVALTTYSPGDGVTRYRLGTTEYRWDGKLQHDYFGDNALCTALGAREALTMVNAYIAGTQIRMVGRP